MLTRDTGSGIVGGMCRGLGVPLRYRGTLIGVLLILAVVADQLRLRYMASARE